MIFNIMFLRNTMSPEILNMCEAGKVPWLRVEGGKVTEESKTSLDKLFLQLDEYINNPLLYTKILELKLSKEIKC